MNLFTCISPAYTHPSLVCFPVLIYHVKGCFDRQRAFGIFQDNGFNFRLAHLVCVQALIYFIVFYETYILYDMCFSSNVTDYINDYHCQRYEVRADTMLSTWHHPLEFILNGYLIKTSFQCQRRVSIWIFFFVFAIFNFKSKESYQFSPKVSTLLLYLNYSLHFH